MINNGLKKKEEEFFEELEQWSHKKVLILAFPITEQWAIEQWTMQMKESLYILKGDCHNDRCA